MFVFLFALSAMLLFAAVFAVAVLPYSLQQERQTLANTRRMPTDICNSSVLPRSRSFYAPR
jgi:hypothetical protein